MSARASWQLEDISRLESYVRETQCVLIFLSKTYFLSPNCLREVREAARLNKPVILVLELNRRQGGETIAVLREECPNDVREYVFGAPGAEREIINYHRVQAYQLVMLRQIADSLLRATSAPPGTSRNMATSPPSGTTPKQLPLYIPSERYHFGLFCLPKWQATPGAPVRLFTSQGNQRALSFVDQLIAHHRAKSGKGKQRSAHEELITATQDTSLEAFMARQTQSQATTAAETYMLLLLDSSTFSPDADSGKTAALVADLHYALDHQMTVLLLHDTGSVEFDQLIYRTPEDLLQKKLFARIAVPYYTTTLEHEVTWDLLLGSLAPGAQLEAQGQAAMRGVLAARKSHIQVRCCARDKGAAKASFGGRRGVGGD